MKQSVSAAEEFDEGRILWSTNGWPLDARKPSSLGECLILGCSNKAEAPSCLCVERHGPPTAETR